MTTEEFKALALSFEQTIEAPHFDRTAYKVVNKRIYATVHQKSGTANLKLSQADQSIFCSYEGGGIYPVDNKWGLHGWTTFEISNLPPELIMDALDLAYREVFKTKKKNS